MFSFGGCWEDVPAPGYSGRGQRGDRGDPSRTCGFGGGVSLHRLCPNTVMLGASPSGAAVPVLASPGHPSGLSLAACPPNSDSRRGLFGETICARLLLGGAAPSSRHGRNLAWGATSPGPTTACAGGSGAAGFIPALLPPTPFGAPGHPCGHSWSGISSSFPPHPF